MFVNLCNLLCSPNTDNPAIKIILNYFFFNPKRSILHSKKTPYNPSDVLLYKPPFLNKANLIDQFSDGPNYLCTAVPREEHIIRTVGVQPVITTLY